MMLDNICDKRGRSLRSNYRLSLCGHLIYPKDFKQVRKKRTHHDKRKRALSESPENLNQSEREPENQGQLPGQGLTGKPELDVRIYWLIMTLPWKHSGSGVCVGVCLRFCVPVTNH